MMTGPVQRLLLIVEDIDAARDELAIATPSASAPAPRRLTARATRSPRRPPSRLRRDVSSTRH